MLEYLNYSNILTLLQTLIDLTCIWVLFYYVLKIVKNNSRTIQIFKGIVFIIIIKAVASMLGLMTVEWIANQFIQWGPLAVIIIFQPEIRNILEKLGKTNVFSRLSTLTVNEREKLVDELVKTCKELSRTSTGALISLEQGMSLTDYIKTGTPMNSMVTQELLCSIFVPGTPLHDGAVIIQGDKIACASAYFPPTTMDFPSSYGARHRAAVGISEISDCVTIVVSEETGKISIAKEGQLTVVDEEELRKYLLMVICQTNRVVSDTNEIKSTNVLEQMNDNPEIIPAIIEKQPGKLSKYIKKKTKALKKDAGKEDAKENVEVLKEETDEKVETEVKEEKAEKTETESKVIKEKTEKGKQSKKRGRKPKVKEKNTSKKSLENEVVVDEENKEEYVINYQPEDDSEGRNS